VEGTGKSRSPFLLPENAPCTGNIYVMRLMTYEQWSAVASKCEKCGGEFWGDSDTCPDCRDSNLEPTDAQEPRRSERHLPSFGIPTTKSQNIYYL
jgi:hypothetical protein